MSNGSGLDNEYHNGLEHLTIVYVPRTLDKSTIMEILSWLHANVRGRYFVPVNKEMVMFHNAEDAVVFKLKFGL